MAEKDSSVNAPVVTLSPSDIQRGRAEYEGRVGNAVVLRRSQTLWGLSATAISVVLAITIMMLLPLKTIEVKIVVVNKITGEAKATDTARSSKDYQPGEAEKTYWLARFTDYVVGIDTRRDITEDRLARASEMTRGKAADQLSSYLVLTKPIKIIMEDPNFSRRITVRAVNFIRNTTTASVQFRVEDQTVGRPATQKNYIMKADYAFVTPSGLDQIIRNPLGMYVIDFVINEDVR